MTQHAPPPDLLPPPVLAQLRAMLPDLVAEPAVPLRGGRCNRLWRIGSVVAKLYAPGSARPLFPNDPLAEAAALRALAGTGLAPGLLLAGPGWIAYRFVPGTPWNRDPRPVAQALAAVHRHPPPPGLRQMPLGDQALMASARAMAHPGLPPPPKVPTVAAPTPCLLHGDAVPGNIITGPQGLTLIDWQCPGLGDPAEDLALFLSPAMQQLYRGAPLSPAETAAFLAAYPDADIVARYRLLRPLLHWRIAAHCALRAAEGAADYRAALGLELAAL